MSDEQDANEGRRPRADLGFDAEVQRKAERMRRARRPRPALWRQLANVGVLGWLFMLPVLLGAFLGRLLKRASGSSGLGLLVLLAGLAVGSYAAYRQVRLSLERADDDDAPGEEP